MSSYLISPPFYIVSSHFISSNLIWSCLLLHLLYYARQKLHEDRVVAPSTKDDTLSIENQVLQESTHEPLDLSKMCDGWLPSLSISTPFQKTKAFMDASLLTAAAGDALQNVLKGQASHLHTTMHTCDSPVCVQHMIDGEEKKGKVPESPCMFVFLLSQFKRRMHAFIGSFVFPWPGFYDHHVDNDRTRIKARAVGKAKVYLNVCHSASRIPSTTRGGVFLTPSVFS